MGKNIAKRKLEKDKPVLGAFLGFYSPHVVEMFGYAGFDFVIIDREHGNISAQECEIMVRAAEVSNTMPFVRVPDNDRSSILKTLDMGGMGIQVPMINNKEDAQKAVDFAKYSSKENSRGLTFSTRAAKYGISVNKDKHIEDSNRESLVVVQIETRKAIENLQEILTVEGVDVVFIGPSDLSQSLGYPGQVDHPEVDKTIRKTIEEIVKAGKTPGVFLGNIKDAEKWIGMGVKYLACGGPSIMSMGIREYVSEFEKI